MRRNGSPSAFATYGSGFRPLPKAGEAVGKPVLSVAAVEFIDGSVWSAPTGRAHE